MDLNFLSQITFGGIVTTLLIPAVSGFIRWWRKRKLGPFLESRAVLDEGKEKKKDEGRWWPLWGLPTSAPIIAWVIGGLDWWWAFLPLGILGLEGILEALIFKPSKEIYLFENGFEWEGLPYLFSECETLREEGEELLIVTKYQRLRVSKGELSLARVEVAQKSGS